MEERKRLRHHLITIFVPNNGMFFIEQILEGKRLSDGSN